MRILRIFICIMCFALGFLVWNLCLLTFNLAMLLSIVPDSGDGTTIAVVLGMGMVGLLLFLGSVGTAESAREERRAFDRPLVAKRAFAWIRGSLWFWLVLDGIAMLLTFGAGSDPLRWAITGHLVLSIAIKGGMLVAFARLRRMFLPSEPEAKSPDRRYTSNEEE